LERINSTKQELSKIEDDKEEEKISLIEAATMAL
jgi:hypothetical protein